MSQNGKKVCRKQSGYDVTKDLKVTMGRNVAIFMGKMDVKYMRINVTMRQNVAQFVLAKNAVDRMFTCDILPKKCSKRNVQEWTNYLSTLRSNVTVGAVNARTLSWVDISRVTKHY
jgi:hypothetical protein